MPKKLSREELLKEIMNKQWNVYEPEHLEFLLNEFEEDLLPFLDVATKILMDFTDPYERELSLKIIERIYKEKPKEQLSIVEKLVKQLGHNLCDYQVFSEISETLVKLENSQTVPLLVEFIKTSLKNRVNAVETIYRLTKHPNEFLSMVPELLALSYVGMPEKLVKFLGEMKNEEAYEFLLEMTKSESYSDIRGRLARALSNYPTQETVEFLMTQAQFGQRSTRWTAISCLADIQAEEAVPLLSEFYLGNEPEHIKKPALKALIKLSKRSKEADKFLKEHYYLGDTL